MEKAVAPVYFSGEVHRLIDRLERDSSRDDLDFLDATNKLLYDLDTEIPALFKVWIYLLVIIHS